MKSARELGIPAHYGIHLTGRVWLGWRIQGVFHAGAVCSMAMSMFLVAIGK
jgi:hypothetical protein